MRVNDSGTWRQIQEVYVNDAGAWRTVFRYFSITSPFTALNKSRSSTGPITTTITLGSDGGITSDGSGAGSSNWGSPTTAGIGSGYWARVTVTAGDALTSNAMSGWTQLSTARSITLQAALSGDNFSSTFTIQIATDSGGTNVVANWTGNVIAAQRN